jgi:hypothetical protein
MLVPHQGPEFRSHFLRRSNNVALIVYHLRKTINRLLNAKPFAAASFAWLMPTQLHRPHHGLAEHRCEACAPIPGDRWERRHQFVCPMSAIGRFCCKSRKSNNPKNLAKVDLWTSLLMRRFSTPVCTENLNTGVVVMKSVQDGA